MECVLILHNLRSVHNVGSLFRTADALGVSHIILSGYTPTPVDRFGRMRPDLRKVALGAEETVPWEAARNPHRAIARLRREGFRIVALEQDPRARPLKGFRIRRKFALLLGNEVRGLSKALRRACDAVVEIPMRGRKESLNVGVAAGIALFSLL